MPRILGGPHPKAEGQDGEKSVEGNKAVKRFTEVYPVLGDNHFQTPDDIIDKTPDLPQTGVFATQKRGCICKRVTAVEIDTAALLWEVTCYFDSDITPIDPTQDEFPAPTWDWSTEWEEVVLEFDAVDGSPIQNSASQPIVMTTPFPIPHLRIQKYQLIFEADVLLLYQHKTNRTTFWGAPRMTALMSNITDQAAAISFDGKTRKVRLVTYDIAFKFRDLPKNKTLYLPGGKPFDSRPEIENPGGRMIPNPDFNGTYLGWARAVLDQGTRYIDGDHPYDSVLDTFRYVPFLDKYGKETTGNLDGTGHKLAPGQPEVYIVFRKCTEVDFNDLELGPFQTQSA